MYCTSIYRPFACFRMFPRVFNCRTRNKTNNSQEKGRPTAGWWFRWQGERRVINRLLEKMTRGAWKVQKDSGTSRIAHAVPALCGSIPLRAFRGREIYWVPLRGRPQSECSAPNEPMQNNPCNGPCTKNVGHEPMPLTPTQFFLCDSRREIITGRAERRPVDAETQRTAVSRRTLPRV